MIFPHNPDRRRFLKVGLLGSATLTIASCSSLINRQSEVCDGCEWLRNQERTILQAIIPVMLEGAITSNTKHQQQVINDIIKGIDFTIVHFPSQVRDEIQQLFWVLQFPPTKSLVAGIWGSWKNAEQGDVRVLLENWKQSDFDLLRVGYSALHDLIMGAWYADPRSWKNIHYQGPPLLT